MKKSLLKFSLISLAVFIIIGFPLLNNIFAQTGYNDIRQQAEEMAQDSPIKTPDAIFDILAGILRYAYTIFFIVAIIFILIAAFNFLTAKDNPEKVKSARSQLMWAAVAIAIALISVGAANIVLRFLENP